MRCSKKSGRFHERSRVTLRLTAKSVAQAVQWLLHAAERLGGQPLLYVPQRNIDGFDELLVRLSRRVQTETWKTLWGSRWPGGAGLAAWPGRDQIAKLDADPRTRALCVLSWTEGDVTAWRAARQPEFLSPSLNDISSRAEV